MAVVGPTKRSDGHNSAGAGNRWRLILLALALGVVGAMYTLSAQGGAGSHYRQPSESTGNDGDSHHEATPPAADVAGVDSPTNPPPSRSSTAVGAVPAPMTSSVDSDDPSLGWAGTGCFLGATLPTDSRTFHRCRTSAEHTSPSPSTGNLQSSESDAAANATGESDASQEAVDDDHPDHPGMAHCAFVASADPGLAGRIGMSVNSEYARLNSSHQCLQWRKGQWCAAGTRGANCQPVVIQSEALLEVASRVVASRKPCDFNLLRKMQNEDGDGAFRFDESTGRISVSLPEGCGGGTESFTAMEILALLHKFTRRGTRPFVITGDSMMRQFLFRLVFALRGKQPAVEYTGWYDVTYVVRGGGDEVQYRVPSKTVAKQVLAGLSDELLAEVSPSIPRLVCDTSPDAPPEARCLLHVQLLWEPYEDTFNRAMFLRSRPPGPVRSGDAEQARQKAIDAALAAEEQDAAGQPSGGAHEGDDEPAAAPQPPPESASGERTANKHVAGQGAKGVDRTACHAQLNAGGGLNIPAEFVPAVHVHAAMYWFPLGKPTRKARTMRRASADADDGSVHAPESVSDVSAIRMMASQHRVGPAHAEKKSELAGDSTDDDGDEESDRQPVESGRGEIGRRGFVAQGSTVAHRVRTGTRKKSTKTLKLLRRLVRFFEAIGTNSQNLDWAPNPGSTATEAGQCSREYPRTRIGYHMFALGAPLMRVPRGSEGAPGEIVNRNQMIMKRNHAYLSTVSRAASFAHGGVAFMDERARDAGLEPNRSVASPSLLEAGVTMQYMDYPGLLRHVNHSIQRDVSKDAKHYMCGFHPPYPRPIWGSQQDERGCHDDVNLAMWTWLLRSLLEIERLPADTNGTIADTWVPQ